MNQYSRYIVIAAVTAGFLFLAWFFSDVVAYILVSFVLAMLGKPIVDMLSKLHVKSVSIPRWLGAMVALTVIWVVALAVFFIFVPIIVQKTSVLSTMDMSSVINSISEPLIGLETSLKSLFPADLANLSLNTLLRDKLNEVVNLSALNKVFSSIADVLISSGIALFSITFITFFFLKDDSLFHDGVVVLFPAKYEDNINRALASIKRLLTRYFIGLFFESLVMLVLVTTGMLIIGIDLNDALLIGLIVGVLNIIPYVGPYLGGALGVLIGCLTYGFSGAMIIGMVSVCIVAQLTDNIFLQPWIYSNSVKAHPLEIFLVILIAGNVAGVMGMLLAIPAYTVLRILGKEFFNNLRVVQKLTQKI